MKNNTGNLYDKYKGHDFGQAKSIPEIPALSQLQSEASGKLNITLRVDNEIIKTSEEPKVRKWGFSPALKDK